MYRLRKYSKGWIVERKIYKRYLLLICIKEWIHVTGYSGMQHKPFYYETAEGARDGALEQIKEQINFSFYHPNMV